LFSYHMQVLHVEMGNAYVSLKLWSECLRKNNSRQ
jgi:hypothetical protein